MAKVRSGTVLDARYDSLAELRSAIRNGAVVNALVKDNKGGTYSVFEPGYFAYVKVRHNGTVRSLTRSTRLTGIDFGQRRIKGRLGKRNAHHAMWKSNFDEAGLLLGTPVNPKSRNRNLGSIGTGQQSPVPPKPLRDMDGNILVGPRFRKLKPVNGALVPVIGRGRS